MTITELQKQLDRAKQNALSLCKLTESVISIQFENSYFHIAIMSASENELLFNCDYDTIGDLNNALDMLIIGANLRAGKEI